MRKRKLQIFRLVFSLTIIIILITGCESPGERAANHLEQAQAAYDNGDYVKAELNARNAAQIEPKNAEARYLLALTAEQLEKRGDVVGNLSIVVDEDPNHVDARIRLGTIYFFSGLHELATEQVEALMELAPDNLDARVLRVRMLVQQGNREAAIEEIEAILEVDPAFLDAIQLHVAAYAQTDPDKALQILVEGIERMGPDRSKLLRQIQLDLLIRLERMNEAESQALDLLDDYPDDDLLWYGLASLYVSQEKLDDAEALMRRNLERDPANVEARLVYLRFLTEARKVAPESVVAAARGFIDEFPDQLQLRLALARYYESIDRPQDALKTYQEIRQLGPKTAEGLEARNLIAVARIREDEIGEGRAMIEAILADEPDNADALLTRALLSYLEEAYDDAIADLRIALRKEPASVRGLLRLGRAHYYNGDPLLARQAYQRLLEVEPAHADASIELAALLAEEGDVAEAETLLRNRLTTEPTDADAANRLVELLLAQDLLDEAEQEARRWISAGEGDEGRTYMALGRVLEAGGRYDEAIKAYLRVVEEDATDEMAIESMIRASVAGDQVDSATDYVRAHLQEHPDQVAIRFLLGLLYLNKKEYAPAIAEFERVISVADPNPLFYSSLALSHPDDINARIEALERGLEAIPNDEALVLYLTADYQIDGRIDDAITALENLLQVNPGSVVAKNDLAVLLLDYRSDATSHNRALQLASTFSGAQNAALLDTLGWAYYRTGNYETAIAYLETAVSLASEVSELRYHLGMAYLALENRVGAQQELDRAISLVQDDGGSSFRGIDEARATLKQLEDG